MTLTDRDRKIMLALVPVLVLVAYWFLLLAPKREEASKASDELTTQQTRVDNARAQVQSAQGAKDNFDASYSQLVRLGKAIPSTLDMPSLLVQLDAAAAGTGIKFTRIATGDRVPNQAFRVGDLAWGTQFHCEVNRSELEFWLEEFTKVGDLRSEWGKSSEQVREEAERFMAEHESRGREVFERFTNLAAGA